MENTSLQPKPLETSSKKQPTLPLILGVILLLLLVGGGGYYLGSQKSVEPSGTQPISTSVPSPTISDTDSVVSPSPKVITPITIPSDWKQYTATDPDFGIKTTMSMPPGFSFQFTGSEFLIKNNSDSTELWDYSTSIFRSWVQTCNKENDKFEDFGAYLNRCCSDKITNNYNNTSRRVWYEKYLNGNYSCTYPATDAVMGKILNAIERPIGNTTYLEVTVDPTSSEKHETHYLYLQNQIMHIIKPSSDKANSSEAQIPKYIGTIFASLTSGQTK